MKIRNLISCALCGLTLFACSPSGGGKDREMDRFITDLMDRMTLREKLGQLNLPSGGDLVTGSVMNGELSDMIRKQEIGGFFNVKGIQKINAPCGRRKPIENTSTCRCRRYPRLRNYFPDPIGTFL